MKIILNQSTSTCLLLIALITLKLHMLTFKNLTVATILHNSNYLNSLMILSVEYSKCIANPGSYTSSFNDGCPQSTDKGPVTLQSARVDILFELRYITISETVKILENSKIYIKHILMMYKSSLGEIIVSEIVEILLLEITFPFQEPHAHLKSLASTTHSTHTILTAKIYLSMLESLKSWHEIRRHKSSSILRQGSELNSREERSRQYFSTTPDEAGQDDLDLVFGMAPESRGGAQQQLLLLEEENTRTIVQHEQEVRQIVRSIADLNHIFKDLAHLVADQGTILDRIDYNVEQTQMQVQHGYQQLQKADKLQRKNRKMVCILVLATSTILMTILLIIIKT
ncbi:hypothetical protein PR048_018430 [Dryococelus australis]|uniref:t-SNARE coiled-coil homology domain-containing protein n=1 Tax=Dryococelus australis TaxID=614101 RepID=A0ABQ9HCB0_9NEOP|nr:hypothetical protein PR048_018430 [Dryococelus australis]